MLLVVENSPERAALMYQRLPKNIKDNTIWVSSSADAIETLRDYKDQISILTLEHDLVYPEMDCRRVDCGMEVIRWLESNDFSKHLLVVLHTWNYKARVKMLKRLIAKNYWVISKPFGE